VVVVAFIFLVVAVLLVIAAVFGGGDATSLDLGSFNLEASVAVMFFLGMGTLLLFVLSLALFRASARRAAARRADRKRVGELSNELDAYKREDPDHRVDERP
jgi:hypothetical protein